MQYERKGSGASKRQPPALGAVVRTLSIATVVAVAGSGCGGDKGGSGGGNRAETTSAVTTTLTTTTAHQRFLADAEAICADTNRKERELGAQGPGWVGTEQFDDPEYLADFNAVGRAALRQLKALTPPEADAKTMEMVIDSIARMVHALDGRIAALRAGRTGNQTATTRPYYRAYGDLTSAAGALGLAECQGILL